MDDLAICKRIAEIEGFELTDHLFKLCKIKKLHSEYCKLPNLDDFDKFIECADTTGFDAYRYNPLTDDALCFQLMVKYKIGLRLM